MTRLRKWLIRLAPAAALAAAALGNAGCLVVAAGAAGAGAVTYAYYNGLLYRDYHANIADADSATRTALTELQFPVLEQKIDTGSAYVKTRTADGHTVRIHLDVVPSPIPAEGSLTRVSIRVGFSGDEAVSARLLDQINLHLAPPGTAPVTPAPPSGAALGAPLPLAKDSPPAVRQAVHETPPPPLAPLAPLAPPASPPVPLIEVKR